MDEADEPPDRLRFPSSRGSRYPFLFGVAMVYSGATDTPTAVATVYKSQILCSDRNGIAYAVALVRALHRVDDDPITANRSSCSDLLS
jgi:hypothetical protein